MNALFQISGQATVLSERIAIILGFITLGSAMATFASCRTFVSLLLRLGAGNPIHNKVYQSFNRYHGYYWWAFGVSVLTHIMMAIFHTGLPQAGDPDAGTHWIILILGMTTAIMGIVLFFSCRITPKLLAPLKSKSSRIDKIHRSFLRFHPYFWWVFVLLAAAHFAAAYLHAGLWPQAG
jgi:cytochrome b561